MADIDDLVRTEAYLIWESEGYPDGQHDRHWIMALERVQSRAAVKPEAPVIPLPLKRVMLSARLKRKPQDATSRLAANTCSFGAIGLMGLDTSQTHFGGTMRRALARARARNPDPKPSCPRSPGAR